MNLEKINTYIITTPIYMEFIRIPAGDFLMGSDRQKDPYTRPQEQPQHQCMLPEYYLGKYPVTNVQYWNFVQATNHNTPRHWHPSFLSNQIGIPNKKESHPVTSVSWFDAVAFCYWLYQKTGLLTRLPSEAEWEKAARGTDGRIYPWGNEIGSWLSPKMFTKNTDTTPVGHFSPRSDSPYGLADMAGNVWEWTRSLWGKKSDMCDFGYPYRSDDGRENLHAEHEQLRVLRGGFHPTLDTPTADYSFMDVILDSARDALHETIGLDKPRCAYRFQQNPNHTSVPFGHSIDFGFRVALLLK